MTDSPIDPLKPFNAVIQICPICDKVDAYLNDGHDCDMERARQEVDDHDR